MALETFLRRKDAAKFLREKIGYGSESMLAKGAVTGNGPRYRKANRVVLYLKEDLEEWARSQIGAPRTSTSAESGAQRRAMV
jgi:hypothetical protein